MLEQLSAGGEFWCRRNMFVRVGLAQRAPIHATVCRATSGLPIGGWLCYACVLHNRFLSSSCMRDFLGICFFVLRGLNLAGLVKTSACALLSSFFFGSFRSVIALP